MLKSLFSSTYTLSALIIMCILGIGFTVYDIYRESNITDTSPIIEVADETSSRSEIVSPKDSSITNEVEHVDDTKDIEIDTSHQDTNIIVENIPQDDSVETDIEEDVKELTIAPEIALSGTDYTEKNKHLKLPPELEHLNKYDLSSLDQTVIDELQLVILEGLITSGNGIVLKSKVEIEDYIKHLESLPDSTTKEVQLQTMRDSLRTIEGVTGRTIR